MTFLPAGGAGGTAKLASISSNNVDSALDRGREATPFLVGDTALNVGTEGRREAGVTLMELMVVVAIVGVLAAIAYPSYTQFVMQTNRTDATKTIQLAAQSLERCYSQYFTYINSANTPCNIIAGNTTSPQGFYTITVAIADAQDYTITATPLVAPQTGDSRCKVFTLSSSGQQAAQDAAAKNTTQLCWGSN